MRIGFEKPVGSHADVKELEYISALHQTGLTIRKNGSIEADDIVALLHSRFGLEVKKEAIEDEVLVDLAGDPKNIPTHVLDLRQAIAILLIPHLLRCLKERDPDDQIASIVDEIRSSFLNATLSAESEHETSASIMITKAFVTDLLAHCDEMDVSEELVEQMVEVAGGEGVEFNTETFLKALTQDLEGYNLEWESRLSTTYMDILGARPPIPMGREGGLVRRSSSVFLRKSATNKSQMSASTTTYSNVKKDAAEKQPADCAKTLTGAEFTYADAEEEPDLREELAMKANKVLTIPGIDNTADLYGSQTFVVLQWCAFMILFVAFVYGGEGDGNIETKCDPDKFGCKVGNAILNWLGIFAQLVVLGGLFFMFTSIANSSFLPHSWISIARVLIGMVAVFVFCVMPEFSDVDTWFFSTSWDTQNQLFLLFGVSAVGVGALLLILQLQTLVRLLVPYNTLQQNETLRRWLEPGILKKDLNTKRAATWKTNKMVENALSLHRTKKSDADQSTDGGGISISSTRRSGVTGQAMFNFLATAHHTEKTGSMIWAWKGFFTGSICYEEGVWFHSRLLASALVQVMVIIVTVTIFAIAVIDVQNAYAVARGEIIYCGSSGCYGGDVDYLYNETTGNWTEVDKPSLKELLNQSVAEAFQEATAEERAEFITEIEAVVFEASGVNVSSPTLEAYYQDGIVGSATKWFVENAAEEDVTFGIAIGFVFSIFSTFWILFGYTPSFVFNVMKFRYGVVPSLYSSDFQLYRNAPDHATIVFGMAFWAQLFTSFLAFLIPGLVAFILVWDETKDQVQGVLAQLVGIAATLLLKILVMLGLRRLLLAGFYRRNLAPANALFLVLECWNVALSAGFLVARTAIFVLCSIFYLGRIDTPFLAPGVDRFDLLPNLFLDRAPVFYRKDLLQHEAHRHPYIDRLAALYLLKLNLGPSFATRAGSCWRLIFSIQLMPWVRRYKVHHDTDEVGAEDDEEERQAPPSKNRGKTLRESVLEEEVMKLRAQTAELKAKMEKMSSQRVLETGDSNVKNELVEEDVVKAEEDFVANEDDVRKSPKHTETDASSTAEEVRVSSPKKKKRKKPTETETSVRAEAGVTSPSMDRRDAPGRLSTMRSTEKPHKKSEEDEGALAEGQYFV
ncbi:expressed unknown protein [Seminavis robusta]|uniref:Uncharacterized protein n=1 Tax=Seminavis robusta TaxID=568900 RepID=A0A9N8DMR9_9STRA|nr:expressed unknown protein [Seminavis robusta]|eukprot:Sro166_g074090.1 n/a (1135) ;mRNA; r:22976-27000